MNGTEATQGTHPVELAGHTWYAFDTDQGPWTTPEFPEWEILRAMRADKTPVYMVYAQLVYIGAMTGLDDAADFIAGHPENKAFAPTEHSDDRGGTGSEGTGFTP
jgi:hypothetical protein